MEEIERLEAGASTRSERWANFRCRIHPPRDCPVPVGPGPSRTGGPLSAAASRDDVQQRIQRRWQERRIGGESRRVGLKSGGAAPMTSVKS